jgi:hypothetical protein
MHSPEDGLEEYCQELCETLQKHFDISVHFYDIGSIETVEASNGKMTDE